MSNTWHKLPFWQSFHIIYHAYIYGQSLCHHISVCRRHEFLSEIIENEVFSLKFKRLICLIEKFSLSLYPYIDNSF